MTAIILPILVMGGWISTYLAKSNTGTEVTLKIRGYDPRDLLSGHYLTYAIDYGSPVTCPGQKREWCLCLKQGREEEHVLAYQQDCHVMSSCSTILKGFCEYKRFSAGIERYYFPERYKDKLRVVPPDSAVTVALGSNGNGIVTQLKVKGLPLLLWLQQQYD